MKDVGKRLRECRLAAGMTQEEASLRMGHKGRSYVCEYENGRCEKMTIPTLKKFAALYGVSPQYLLGWTDLTLEEEQLVNIYREDDDTYRKMMEMILFNHQNTLQKGGIDGNTEKE